MILGPGMFEKFFEKIQIKRHTVSVFGLLKADVGAYGLDDQYGEPVPYNISDGLITGCNVCHKDQVIICEGCKAVSYCSREHQLTDRPEHKTVCSLIKEAQAYVKQEEDKLNAHKGNFEMKRDPFKKHVGRFWIVKPTRNYLRARFSVVDSLLRINTKLAIATALEIILDMQRLCRTDNIGARGLIPALFLRLNEDQKSYDFIKWWATTGNHETYDFDNLNLPYLDVQNADVFEAVDDFNDDTTDLPHLVALTLLKIRLLIDLTSLDPTNRQAKIFFPEEIINLIQERGPTVRFGDKTEIIKRDQATHIRNIKQQIKVLYKNVKKANFFMWIAMLNPGDDLNVRPNFSTSGDRAQMQLALQFNYNAWKETPGAFDVIKKLSKVMAD